MNYKGKVAFITGGGGYIGGECAYYIAKRGGKVAVCDINAQTVENTVKRITDEGGIARGYVFDVTDSSSVNSTVAQVVSDFGSLDISIHVAGGSARVAPPNPDGKSLYQPIVDQEDSVIDAVLKINLYGAIYVARAAGKQMIKQGNGGRIISFSSTVGVNGLIGCVEYGAAKGGVISFTKGLAKELGQYGITVNSVAPGIVQRPGTDINPEKTLNTNFLHQKCTAEDVASLVGFVASDEARFITGQTYIIDGGRCLAMKGSE